MTWTYQCYVTSDVPNLWEAWYDAHPRAQGRHDAAFDILDELDAWNEARGIVDKLEGKDKDGIIEVRFKVDNVQWRIFGFYGKARREFIVVHVGNHKGNTYTPKKVLDTAASRMKEVNADASRAKKCDRPGKAAEAAQEGLPGRLPGLEGKGWARLSDEGHETEASADAD